MIMNKTRGHGTLVHLCTLFCFGIFLFFASCDFSFGQGGNSGTDTGKIGNWQNCLRLNDLTGQPNTGSPWNRAIGPDYIEKAFLTARAADPDAKLYYNDYNLNEENKAQAVYNMVKDINQRYPNVGGRPLIDGIGMQTHYSIATDPQGAENSITLFASLGVKIAISEMDIEAAGTFSGTVVAWGDDAAESQAVRYAALFDIFKRHAASIERVTFWGLDDGTSWRASTHPTLLNSDYSLKPAFYAVAGTAGAAGDTWETVQPLQDIYAQYFLLGNIVSPADVGTVRFNLLKRHYSAATAENAMKPSSIAPASAPAGANWAYSWTQADSVVQAVNNAGMKMHGHTLVWHQQTPAWLNTGANITREVALNNLTKYITDVATHFKGKVISWDVVNEAMRDGLTANDVKN